MSKRDTISALLEGHSKNHKSDALKEGTKYIYRNVKFYLSQETFNRIKKSRLTLACYIYNRLADEDIRIKIKTEDFENLTLDKYTGICITTELYDRLATIAKSNFIPVSKVATAIVENRFEILKE